MTAEALTEACADLTRWLPIAQRLITEADDDGTTTGGQPSSRPPWNPAAASAAMDAHEGLRRLEASLRLAITGHPGARRGGSDANTIAAIDAIEHLGAGVTAAAMAEAARILDRWSLAIQQLAAIDEAERWQRVAGACCPYCGNTMLRLAPRAGRVTCLRYGACEDAEGQHPVGHVQRSVSGDPIVVWGDGLIQYGAVEVAP